MEKRWLMRLTGCTSIASLVHGSVACLLISLAAGCSSSSTAPNLDSDSNSASSPAPAPAVGPGDLAEQTVAPQAFTPLADGTPGEYTEEELKEACLTTEQLEQGWVRLFDGQSLWGWFSVGGADWRVQRGMIEVNSGDRSQLCTSFQITNYELLVDFRCIRTTESGICLRSVVDPQDPAHDCIEVNIAPPSDPFPTGSLTKRQALKQPSPVTTDDAEWHTCRILLENQQVKVWLDDQLVNDYTMTEKPRRGHIALQHSMGAISFRNILMRPIGMTPMLSRDNWEENWQKRTASDGQMDVTAAEGKVHLRGGPGQLETKAEWQDFLMQATYKLADPAIDTGILFRCSTKTIDQGYECQLNHLLSPKGRPVAGGAGSVSFSSRASDNVARTLVGDGTQPTYVTLLAEDGQIATWINGLQIADGSDTRDVNDNPRIGSKRSAGPIALQAKEPTTDVEFSRLLIAPIE